MDPENLDQVKSIFFRATELTSGARAAFLDQECGGDDQLRSAVERLLMQHDASPPTGIFEEPTKPASLQTLPEGTLLSSRFRIACFVGRGGMGEVYRATDLDLGGDVALKILLPELVSDRQFLGRFRREVQLARQVTHPNICRIFDVGRDQYQGQELVFLTMEFLDGQTLAAYLRRHGKLAPQQVLPILQQIADGLGALHDKHIIHRDFKPGNVMIVGTPSGKQRAVIGDFGLARTADTAVPLDRQDETLSRPGHFYGTFGYMAPEQLRGKPLTTAADIYALGIVIYEMVTGKRLFPAGVTLEDAVQRVNEEVKLPENHGLTEEWEAAILQCLALDPARRPPSALAALAMVRGTEISPVPSRIPKTVPEATAVQPPGKTRSWLWIAAPVLAALTLIAFAVPALREKVMPAEQSTSARSELERALKLAPTYYKRQDLAAAITLLEKIVATDPASARAQYELGRAYYRSYLITSNADLLPKARKALEQAIDLSPALAGPHVALGEIHLETGKNDLAANELQQALRLDSRSAEVYQALGQLYRKQGRDAEVLPALQKAVDLDPSSWNAITALGLYYRDTGKLTEAIAELEKAAKLVPDNPSAFNNLGLAYLNQDRFTDAHQALEKSIALDPNHNRTYGNLGLVLMLEGKFNEAALVFQKAIDLNPTSYNAWGALASAYAWSAENKSKAPATYQRAIELAEEARKLRPKNTPLIAYLGSLYATIGKRDLSLPLIRQATAMEPDRADIAIRAGEAYELLHMREEAVRWTIKAIEAGYSKEVIKRSPELAGLRADPRLKDKLR
jgi:tetratricopeptide (TPR) repeat protein